MLSPACGVGKLPAFQLDTHTQRIEEKCKNTIILNNHTQSLNCSAGAVAVFSKLSKSEAKWQRNA
jgi:hypothetical protein